MNSGSEKIENKRGGILEFVIGDGSKGIGTEMTQSGNVEVNRGNWE